MSTKQKIFIPTYISSVDYAPARVQPRILFYNGPKACETYYIRSGSTATTFDSFPYFDNYSGENTTTESLSLLFNNEVAPYGELPTSSLYTEYWENYINLLYNPRTRLVNASAIIPLADYFKMELNSIAQFRGNYYHIRAINDYNLTTGECNIQLLGPVLEGSLNFDIDFDCGFSYTASLVPPTTTTSTTTTTTTICPSGNPNLNNCFKVRFRNVNEPNRVVYKYYECNTGEIMEGTLGSDEQIEACVVSGSFNGANVINICSGSTYSIVGTQQALVLGNCNLNPNNCLSITFTNTGAGEQIYKFYSCGAAAENINVLEGFQSQTVCVISGSNAPCPSCFTYPLVDYSYYAPAGVSVTINGTCTP